MLSEAVPHVVELMIMYNEPCRWGGPDRMMELAEFSLLDYMGKHNFPEVLARSEHVDWGTWCRIDVLLEIPAAAALKVELRGERAVIHRPVSEIFVACSGQIYLVNTQGITQVKGTFAQDVLCVYHGEEVSDLDVELAAYAEEIICRVASGESWVTPFDAPELYSELVNDKLRNIRLAEVSQAELETLGEEIKLEMERVLRSQSPSKTAPPKPTLFGNSVHPNETLPNDFPMKKDLK